MALWQLVGTPGFYCIHIARMLVARLLWWCLRLLLGGDLRGFPQNHRPQQPAIACADSATHTTTGSTSSFFLELDALCPLGLRLEYTYVVTELCRLRREDGSIFATSIEAHAVEDIDNDLVALLANIYRDLCHRQRTCAWLGDLDSSFPLEEGNPSSTNGDSIL